jgi:hypothetical protein
LTQRSVTPREPPPLQGPGGKFANDGGTPFCSRRLLCWPDTATKPRAYIKIVSLVVKRCSSGAGMSAKPQQARHQNSRPSPRNFPPAHGQPDHAALTQRILLCRSPAGWKQHHSIQSAAEVEVETNASRHTSTLRSPLTAFQNAQQFEFATVVVNFGY